MTEQGLPIATINVQYDDATHNRFGVSHPYLLMVERRLRTSLYDGHSIFLIANAGC